MKFEELNLKEEVLKGIESVGFEECTKVQEKVLPITLSGRDTMVQSKTGSGKTAVFLITILEHYIERGGKSRALIVAPTRELAVQIEEDAIALSASIPDYKVGVFYGGVGYSEQDKEIKSGASLFVGTPGRLLDYARSRKIDFRQFDVVVLDEADRMFDMGFFPDIQKMFGMMRKSSERLTLLFSATLSSRVRNLAWGYMNEPEEVLIEPEEITVKEITQVLFHVSKKEKFGLLLSILKKINPRSCLVFTNTKERAVEVSKRLNMNGYKAEYLMGDMPQSKRLKTLIDIKEGKIEYLVATDVAARGLQIDDLELVVNYDIPEDYENYVHRIGRTARAGRKGIAVTLACEEYIYSLEAIEDFIGMKIPVKWADEEDLEEVEDKSAGYKAPRRSTAAKSHQPSNSRKDVRNRKPTFRDKEITKEHESTLSYKSRTDFNALKSMSLEERMKYYQRAFSNSDNLKKDKDEKEMKSASDNNAQTTSLMTEGKPLSGEKEVAKLFFKRIVSFFKGNKNE